MGDRDVMLGHRRPRPSRVAVVALLSVVLFGLAVVGSLLSARQTQERLDRLAPSPLEAVERAECEVLYDPAMDAYYDLVENCVLNRQANR